MLSKLADALDDAYSPIKCLADAMGLGRTINTEPPVQATSEFKQFQFSSLVQFAQDSPREMNFRVTRISTVRSFIPVGFT